MSKKMIITFEGIEGSGKTLHIENVAKYLKKKKISFVKLREPGGSKNSEKIRKLILNNKSNFNRYTDLLLYLAARSENIEKILIKNYQKKVILIDRFTDSTLAYQHYGMGISKKFIDHLNRYLLKKIKINFTFLNIVNKKNLKKRLFKRNHMRKKRFWRSAVRVVVIGGVAYYVGYQQGMKKDRKGGMKRPGWIREDKK